MLRCQSPCGSKDLPRPLVSIRLSSEQRALGRVDFLGVVAPRKQVPITVIGHGDGAVTQPFLHDLRREPKAPVLFSVDQPACVEMPERMHAGVFGLQKRLPLGVFLRLSLFIEDGHRDPCLKLSRAEPAIDNAVSYTHLTLP